MADTPRHVRSTRHEHFTASVTGLRHAGQQHFVVRITGGERPAAVETPPLAIALVLDRSGSMQGPKIAHARDAAAAVVRGLRPVDRVAVVAYDHEVSVLGELGPPSEELAQRIRGVQSRGNTALYDGWLTGARLLPTGGRVILLSDGLANEGRFQDAAGLGLQAQVTLRKYGKTTTTIGVGEGYDEALMAAMAREGGGAHYFCRSAESILEAFAQERIQVADTVLWDVVLRAGARDVRVGFVTAGETVTAVADDVAAETHLALSYRTPDGERHEVPLEAPQEFEEDVEARAEWLVERAARLQEAIGRVRSQVDARELLPPVRDLLLEITNHPLADGPVLAPVRARLEASRRALVGLAEQYDEMMAMRERKVAFSSAPSLRSPGKGWAGDASEDELDFVRARHNRAYGQDASLPIVVDPRAFALRDAAYWIAKNAAPVNVADDVIEVVTPTKGHTFVIDELARDLGRPVRAGRRLASSREIREAIRRASA